MPSHDAQPVTHNLHRSMEPHIDTIKMIHDSKAAAICLPPDSIEAGCSTGKRRRTRERAMLAPVSVDGEGGITE
jgi:hypothetical protein